MNFLKNNWQVILALTLIFCVLYAIVHISSNEERSELLTPKQDIERRAEIMNVTPMYVCGQVDKRTKKDCRRILK